MISTLVVVLLIVVFWNIFHRESFADQYDSFVNSSVRSNMHKRLFLHEKKDNLITSHLLVVVSIL